MFNFNTKLPCFFGLLVVFMVTGCGDNTAKDTEDTAQVIRPAKLMKVGQSGGQELLNFPAVIQAQQSSELAFQVAGVISNMAVKEGVAVEKGQILAQLDPRDFKSKLDVATAQFEIADVEYQRALALIDSNVISKSELAKRKADYEVNKSKLATATKALDDTTLRAPFAGRVAKVLSHVEEYIKAGTQVFMLLSLNQLEARINLPSSVIVHSRETDRNEVKAYVVLDAAPEYRIKASFKEAALEADQDSQTYEVIFGFDAVKNLAILPGMSATVLISEFGPKTTPKVTVPLSAIGNDGTQSYVWVVNEKTMSVSKRIVVLEPGIGEEFELLSGLELGETIVTAGISTLIEGAVVRPWVQ